MKKIPTQLENPKGLHQRYQINKIVVVEHTPDLTKTYGMKAFDGWTLKAVPTDEGSEYFVLRLDEGCKDREHIKACRIAIHAYCIVIQYHLPELAKDLRERYPLL